MWWWQAGDDGVGALTFCIGGPFGHSPEVVKQAHSSVRLSDMVLNHQVAYLVLLEQLYRVSPLTQAVLRG